MVRVSILWDAITYPCPRYLPLAPKPSLYHLSLTAGLIPGLRPANERRRYKVTPSLIGWVQTWNHPSPTASCPQYSLHLSHLCKGCFPQHPDQQHMAANGPALSGHRQGVKSYIFTQWAVAVCTLHSRSVSGWHLTVRSGEALKLWDCMLKWLYHLEIC